MNTDFVYQGPSSDSTLAYLSLYDMTSGNMAVDIETVSLDNRDPIGIGFSPNPHESFYFPIESGILPWHLLENPNITQIYHNGHFDLEILKSYFDIDVPHVYDTLIAAQL